MVLTCKLAFEIFIHLYSHSSLGYGKITNIVSFAAGGRFEVDEKSGVVRTRGSEMFQLDMEYVLYVKAEDQNGRIDDKQFQSTPEERLSIVGGKRPPQFYLPKYEKTIPENSAKDSE